MAISTFVVCEAVRVFSPAWGQLATGVPGGGIRSVVGRRWRVRYDADPQRVGLRDRSLVERWPLAVERRWRHTLGTRLIEEEGCSSSALLLTPRVTGHGWHLQTLRCLR